MPTQPSQEGNAGAQRPTATELQAAVAFEHYRALARLRHRTQAALLIELDLSMAHFRLISVLASIPRISISELARRLGTSLPATSKAVDRLVDAGYVERVADPSDRRRTFLGLTHSGLEVADISLGTLQPVRRWLEQLSPEDLAAATVAFDALLRVAEAENVEVEGGAE
jgi:DNA-binding MarR family transcriptional regulator